MCIAHRWIGWDGLGGQGGFSTWKGLESKYRAVSVYRTSTSTKLTAHQLILYQKTSALKTALTPHH